jgi:hypothetical protein
MIRRHINTSRVVEEDMVYEDEPPEILAVMPATGWTATIAGEDVPLIAFVSLDSGRMYGVTPGEGGLIDLIDGDVEKLPDFTGYEQVSK